MVGFVFLYLHDYGLCLAAKNLLLTMGVGLGHMHEDI